MVHISKLARHERGRKACAHILTHGLFVADRADPKEMRSVETDVPSEMRKIGFNHIIWTRPVSRKGGWFSSLGAIRWMIQSAPLMRRLRRGRCPRVR